VHQSDSGDGIFYLPIEGDAPRGGNIGYRISAMIIPAV